MTTMIPPRPSRVEKERLRAHGRRHGDHRPEAGFRAETPRGWVLAVAFPPSPALHPRLCRQKSLDVGTVVGGQQLFDDRVDVALGLVVDILGEPPSDPVFPKDIPMTGVGNVAHQAQLWAGNRVRMRRFGQLPLPQGRDDVFPGVVVGTGPCGRGCGQDGEQ